MWVEKAGYPAATIRRLRLTQPWVSLQTLIGTNLVQIAQQCTCNGAKSKYFSARVGVGGRYRPIAGKGLCRRGCTTSISFCSPRD